MSELEESIKRGLEQSARGETYDLGDFSQYADDPPEIKVIYKRTSGEFEEHVNDALSMGWRLNQPVFIDRTGYFAVLIKE